MEFCMCVAVYVAISRVRFLRKFMLFVIFHYIVILIATAASGITLLIALVIMMLVCVALILYCRRRRRLRLAKNRKAAEELKSRDQRTATATSIIEEKNRQLLSKMQDKEMTMLEPYRKHSLNNKELFPNKKQDAGKAEPRYCYNSPSLNRPKPCNDKVEVENRVNRNRRAQSLTTPTKESSSCQPTSPLNEGMHVSVPLSTPYNASQNTECTHTETLV